jgi:hypothetical protein
VLQNCAARTSHIAIFFREMYQQWVVTKTPMNVMPELHSNIYNKYISGKSSVFLPLIIIIIIRIATLSGKLERVINLSSCGIRYKLHIAQY